MRRCSASAVEEAALAVERCGDLLLQESCGG